ncbi:MAG: hypothetical protein U0800_05115 [Isosphaeraceae bacterium]
MFACHRRSRQRRGFGLIDLVVACFLSVLLAYLVLLSWDTFGRSAILVGRRAQLAQEAEVACARISADLGGYRLEELDAVEPSKPAYTWSRPLVAVQDSGDHASIKLQFSGDGAMPAVDITYKILNDGQSSVLVRSPGASSADEVIARNVLSIDLSQRIAPSSSLPGLVSVDLTLGMPILEDRRRNAALQRTYRLTSVLPPWQASP